MPQLFEALAGLLNVAQIELPTFEDGQQFTLEPLFSDVTDTALCLLFSTEQRCVEIIEFLDKPIVMCGGSHHTTGYDFFDCKCRECQRSEMLRLERLHQGNPTARCRSCGGDYVDSNLVPVDDDSGEYWCKSCHADLVAEKAGA